MSKRATTTAWKLLVGMVLVGFGAAWTFLSLVRLGFMRHGEVGLGFLHLDWIFQPSLRYWGAHMANLASLAIGVAIVAWGGYRIYRAVKSHLAARQEVTGPK